VWEPFQSLYVLIHAKRYICFIYSPTDAQVICLKKILKFTLKQLRHVSVQSHHHEGAHYSCLLASTNNTLPDDDDDDVTAPKHAGAVLM
jgi:hypothetical protein